ncbi:uncharacterized protein LOC127752086 [Frankliniella occidentalis]|uniref:Uncharacterized protein LOC127752086 n=1 Tax=Frankliniella occidentalis TaxID=133901 RepID=A0A9C6XBC0_FRAOC|nr:uncharacterized protein LOC127752086 [Frankliniella occidentalis]
MQHSNSRGFVANTMTAAGVLWEGNPSPHTYTGRTALYVFLWTLFCLHFNPAYRAALAMANVHSLEEPGPTELDDVKRVIVSSADSIPLVKEYPKLNKLLHLVEFCKGPSSCAKEFRRDMKNSALIISGWTYWCYKRILLVDEDGRSLLKDQNDPLAAFHISALIARDSPIAVTLNRIMAIVWQSGMIKTWGLDHRRKIQSLRWIQMKVDLIVVMLGTAGTDIYNTTVIASSTLGAFKHRTPILVIHTAELEPGGEPEGRADVDTIVAALRVTGWMHTIIAVQRHTGSRLQKVPVYLSQPGFVPGARCGFGPSTTTLALTWSEGAALGEDAVRFLEPRRKVAFNGCDVLVAPLYGSPFVFFGTEGEVRGLDIELVNYFAEDSNVTVIFLPVKTAADVNKRVNRWDRLRYTAEQKKDIGSIYQDFDRADVVVGGLFPTIERSSAFDLTAPYCQDTIYAYVTARMPMAAWRYPFGVLRKRVWAAVFGTMLLLVVVLWVAGGGSGLENTIILYSILSDGDPKPKMTSRTKQFVGLVFLWTVFCMHFNSGYRASLAMASINPMGTPGPKSILDVKVSGHHLAEPCPAQTRTSYACRE